MKNDVFYYSVGPLLYCPANKKGIAEAITSEKFGQKFSLALCLEDAVNDNFVEKAENELVASLKKIHRARLEKPFFLPKIFIRVREPSQIGKLYDLIGDAIGIVTGFIAPKFSLENSSTYIEEIIEINARNAAKLYFMPIYESESIIDLRTRHEILYKLKDSLSEIEGLVLNIRVGGNDLCHAFGFRRHSDESIHRIKPVADIFSDIITVYGRDYIISGPVWEYYSGADWEKGLRQEIKDDILCGFTGKTVIHPNQIPIVNRAFQVSKADYDDAVAIAAWNRKNGDYVSASQTKERMNEYKTHTNWAGKIIFMAEAYGIDDRGQGISG